MHIIINHTSMTPIYEQIVSQIRADIINGDMAPGTALPSVRMLSRELKISALTVKKAYDYLEEEGLVHTVHGRVVLLQRPIRRCSWKKEEKSWNMIWMRLSAKRGQAD